MMKLINNKVFVGFIMLLLVVSIFSFASAKKEDNSGNHFGEIKNDDKDKRKKFIARDDNDVALALENGCEQDNNYNHFKVFLCDEKIGENIKLIKDQTVYTVDIDANIAVSANVVQNLGYTGKGVKIAVLDTGIDYNHPDLASSYAGGYDYIHGDSDPFDDNGHGTEVSGVIASDGLNSKSKGIAPDAQIVSMKIADYRGYGSLTAMLESIYNSVDNYNVDVISISMGDNTGISFYCDNLNEIHTLLTQAIAYAHQKNVSVVIAAGNTASTNVSSPGCISSAFSVGGTTNSLMIRTAYAYGNMVDIYAPASSLYTTDLNGGYNIYSGTSMATPMVSGAIALLREKNSNLNWNDYETALLNGAYVRNESFGIAKILNVSSSINLIPQLVVCVQPKTSYSLSNGMLVLSWPSQTGCQYDLKETYSLTQPDWRSIGVFVGNGNVLQHSFYPDGAMRFFRIDVKNI